MSRRNNLINHPKQNKGPQMDKQDTPQQPDSQTPTPAEGTTQDATTAQTATTEAVSDTKAPGVQDDGTMIASVTSHGVAMAPAEQTARGQTAVIQQVDEAGFLEDGDAPKSLTGLGDNRMAPLPGSNDPLSLTSVSPGLKPVEVIKAVPVAPVAKSINDLPFKELIAQLKASGDQDVLQIIRELETYIAAMTPGMPIKPADGIKRQYKLWEALYEVVERSPNQKFIRLWSIVIMFFKEHAKGAFAISHCFRFADQWGRPKDQLTAFHDIMDTLIITARQDAKSVKKVKDITKMVSVTWTEIGRGRLISFYS